MQMVCGSVGLAASVSSSGPPFPGWESSWSLVSALGLPSCWFQDHTLRTFHLHI